MKRLCIPGQSDTELGDSAPQAALSADFISNVQKQTGCSFQASGEFWASKPTKLSYMTETSEHKDQVQTVLQDSRLLDKKICLKTFHRFHQYI